MPLFLMANTAGRCSKPTRSRAPSLPLVHIGGTAAMWLLQSSRQQILRRRAVQKLDAWSWFSVFLRVITGWDAFTPALPGVVPKTQHVEDLENLPLGVVNHQPTPVLRSNDDHIYNNTTTQANRVGSRLHCRVIAHEDVPSGFGLVKAPSYELERHHHTNLEFEKLDCCCVVDILSERSWLSHSGSVKTPVENSPRQQDPRMPQLRREPAEKQEKNRYHRGSILLGWRNSRPKVLAACTDQDIATTLLSSLSTHRAAIPVLLIPKEPSLTWRVRQKSCPIRGDGTRWSEKYIHRAVGAECSSYRMYSPGASLRSAPSISWCCGVACDTPQRQAMRLLLFKRCDCC